MATDGFKSLAGLRKQIIENCYFFNTTSGDISLIITHEPIGTYKAIVLTETSRRRDVLLSSDSFETVTKAFEHLFIKSTDAVQQYITANEFRRLPSVVDADDDDGSSTTSSYVDDSDKNHLADSRITLESELESAYESPSEDGDGTVGHSRARTEGRPQSHDVRTARRDSRSRSHSLSRSLSHGRAPTYRKLPISPARSPVHRWAVDPPQPYFGPTRINDSGNVRLPVLPPQMPPMPGQGPMPSHPRLGNNRPSGASTAYHQQRVSALQQHHEEFKRLFLQGQSTGTGYINVDDNPASQPSLPPGGILPLRSGHPSQPGPWPPLYTGNDHRPYVAPPVTTQPMPHQQTPTLHESPMQNRHQMGKTSPPPLMNSSSASSTTLSSASSTPTVTVNSNTTPPEYSSAWPPASIDYKLVIKTSFTPPFDAGSEDQQHRIIARTPPTRDDMGAVVMNYAQRNGLLLPSVTNGRKRRFGTTVTRAVFSAGHGREESYDLATYPEQDFSKLCEVMKRAGEEGNTGGLPQMSGWPLFEVVISTVPNVGP